MFDSYSTESTNRKVLAEDGSFLAQSCELAKRTGLLVLEKDLSYSTVPTPTSGERSAPYRIP
jgi:hypothetical protein